MTTLVADGALIHVHSQLSGGAEPITSWSGNILHFYLVVFVSLILVYPGLGVERRLKLLLWATAGLFVFHVAAMLIKVEYLYAVEVEGFGARNYGPADRAVYEWLHENTIFLAVQLLPATAIVLMVLLVTFEKRRGQDRRPKPRLPAKQRRRRNLILTGGAVLGAVFLAFLLLDRKVYARQSETDVRIGHEHLGRHETERACEAFLSALDRDPGAIRARGGLGLCRAQEGKFQEAAREFEIVLDSVPDDPETLLQLGMARHHMEDHLGAVETLERYHAIRPDDAEGAYYLAVSLGRLGRDDESEAILRRSLESSPDSPRLLLEMTRTLMLTGRGCRALSYVRRLDAIELDARQESLVSRTLATLEAECVGDG